MMTKRPPTALEKIGLNSPMALALHLPSRSEDETKLFTVEDGITTPVFEFLPQSAKANGRWRPCASAG